ncbi:hypothetical protein [Legionella septentrionalis]|uniref:Uncharacterized protein n=1 Tax=Legionella septentrionalis TaxID=2498109 RepID=A0A3S0XS86_9GAMM|nr:hypothetical protein [Legionella septentrionalis]RUQ81873.1 hypothetical protein EKM59_09290 [Legionella septentrionalis]RUR00243.1 hypothetical protein ELY11_02520 [Legionella septentrionalis]
MPILFIKQSTITLKSYEEFCKHQNHEEIFKHRKYVFIFPGNETHHGGAHNLYSVKGGAGLAALARVLGHAGWPVLSLPTTTMENWATNRGQQKTVTQALCDLWRAAGAGYTLVLPVRSHQNGDYFHQPLANSQDEPNFWGGVQLAANKPLANYYTEQLNLLTQFLNECEENPSLKVHRLQEIEKQYPHLVQSYWDGQGKHPEDPWFAKPGQHKMADRGSRQANQSPFVKKEEQAQQRLSSQAATAGKSNAWLYLTLGCGVLATASATALITGFLASLAVISIAMSPVALMITAAATLAGSLAGAGFFAYKHYQAQNNVAEASLRFDN